jgi:hypothetical protein
MLVYFDPWLAGVVLPGLIIAGLIAIPYVDKNPKGNGYFTFTERKAEITIFLFGFAVLWSSLIVLGTFLRGPNWNFFGPFEFWDVHKLAALTNVNLSEYVWVRALGSSLHTNWFVREIVGILFVLFYVFALPVLLQTLVQDVLREAGRPAVLHDGGSVPDDDVAPNRNARAVDLQPEYRRGQNSSTSKSMAERASDTLTTSAF